MNPTCSIPLGSMGGYVMRIKMVLGLPAAVLDMELLPHAPLCSRVPCRVVQTEVLHTHGDLPSIWVVLGNFFAVGKVYPGMCYISLLMVSQR